MSSLRFPLLGERLPDLVVLDHDANKVRLISLLGGAPCVLLFTSTPHALIPVSVPASYQTLTVCSASLPQPLPQGVFWLCEPATQANGTPLPPYLLLSLDANLRATLMLQADTLDALQRQLANTPIPTPQERPPERIVRAQAPVLTLSNALDLTACKALIQGHAKRSSPTGVEVTHEASRTQRLDAHAKRRRDWIVQEPSLVRMLTTSIGRRIFPELRRVWGIHLDRFEGFKIVSYDAQDRGFFKAHRDNLSPQTQHRRVALTINLNAGFSGGALRFPEFSNDLYIPPEGHAVLFSCSLLHEVTPVTQGTRFALISFLYSRNDPRTTL